MKFDVTRSTMVNAPISALRAWVEDFEKWNAWSPWTVVEPTCSKEITGTPGQEGHTLRWDGDIIGAGSNTLVSTSETSLSYRLEFVKPWKSKADVHFQFEAMGAQTKVTWMMASSMPFFMFFMIKTLTNSIAMDYDRGLRMLKTLAEKGEINCNTKNNGMQDLEGFSYVGLERTVPFSHMPTQMKQDFEKIVKDIVIDGGKGARHWVSLYPKFDMKKMEVTYIAAVSDEDVADLKLGPEYRPGKIEPGRALEITHHGSYEFMGNAWAMGMMTMRAQKMKHRGIPFEQYWNSPMEEKPEDLKSSIYFPLG